MAVCDTSVLSGACFFNKLANVTFFFLQVVSFLMMALVVIDHSVEPPRISSLLRYRCAPLLPQDLLHTVL